MAFKPLSSRLNDLPDVLVGPMLRLVQADQVSVFLVLKAKTKVTLEVFESETNGAGVNRRISGTRSTVQLGAKLHAVCVTAKGPPLLTPGTQYVYDVKLGTADGNDNAEAPAGRGLFTPGVIRGQTSDARDLLLYPQGPQLPSFVLPPAAVDDLRILHASCRKPHGKGEDALAIGDEIVATAIADDFGRPHQLFLGGDQIYADDVAISLLAMLQDAARPTALGFPVETLPTGGGKPGSDFHPDARAEVVTTVAGLTSDDADSHLLTFADFALMYAFAWSDALWPKPPAELPDFAAALEDEYAEWAAEANKVTSEPVAPPHSAVPWKIDKQIAHLEDFRRALPQVRRLLANVPTLMIFDDHEITDDWNLNLDWMKRTQDPLPARLQHATEPTELARAILRNGLVAYAIFQAWGNTPEQFGSGTPGVPGRALLTAVEGWTGAATGSQVDEMTTRVGLPTGFDDHVATRADGCLDWHFRKAWAGHEVIALDTRTRRGTVLAEDSGGPPALIYETADFDKMVRSGPPPGPEQLVLVIAPAPVFGVPLHEAAARHLHAPWVRLSPGSDPEHWALTPYTREHFLSALMSRPAKDTGNVRRARAVVLSGDVHHGSAVHVRYSAVTPFKYEGRVEGVLAQLTSSALKNEGALTRLIEWLGFFTIDSQWRPIVGTNMPLIETSGWANPTGNELDVGDGLRDELTTGSTVVTRTISIKLKGSPALHEFTYGVPFREPPAVPAEPGYQLSLPPEWSYAVRPARGTLGLRDVPGTLDPPAGTPPADRTTRMVRAAQKHTHYSTNLGPGQEVVGHNNIGDVTFDWAAGDDKTVIQKLWWRLDGIPEPHPYSRWEIPLENGST